MSAKYNLVCEQATTFNFQFTIKNDSTPWNLTNYTAVMTVRPFVGASTTTVVASTANGRITLGGALGTVTVNIDATTTGGIAVSQDPWDDPGAWDYDYAWDPAAYVPGYREWLSSRQVVGGNVFYTSPNQRIGIWDINIDANNYERLS